MLRLLVDTCVWLDLAKDYRQRSLLAAVEALIEESELSLIVPQLVLDEFERNKARIAEDSVRSLSGVFRRAREAISEFGRDDLKSATLAGLNEVDHRIGTLGEAVNASIVRIQKLLETAQPFPASEASKLRAAERGLGGRAPFHRQRNSVADAILIETYFDVVESERNTDSHFAFVTHNIKDFSDTDHRMPHSDIASYFGSELSAYSISLAHTLNEIAPELLEDFRFELEGSEEPRRLSEILEALDLLLDQVWYNRHWNRRIAVADGRIALVDKETLPAADHRTRPIQRDIWEGALALAKRVEEKHGLEKLGPWDEFEWGMINGRLSALRWVLGDEWDNLDN